ncbi:uncharacterized protein TNCV_2436981 [Trichonephila clavipes]|nr:uncharacterized protein TNCV_2436981 [Trichonephila clavipes]
MVVLSRTGFASNKVTRKKEYVCTPLNEISGDPATAAALVSFKSIDNKVACIFCDKPHPSHKCFSAKKMSLDEKLKILSKKGACYSCLTKSNHISRHCDLKSKLKCNFCSLSHYIMCSKKLDKHLSVKSSPSTISLSNQCRRDRTVYLQTLCVIARGRERRIRILLDSALASILTLENLGISNPTLEESKQNSYEDALDDFQQKLTILPNGRPVIKLQSETTKYRPCFDGSACENGKPPLNQCLYKGINLLEVIPDILDRFRLYPIGLSADIEKAFLMLSVHPRDRDYLRFSYPTKEELVYRLCRIVFGLNSSPFLLNASIKHLLDNAPLKYCNVVEKLKCSFYVDNCLSGVNNVKEQENFIDIASKLLSKGCFNLRGWQSNVACKYVSQHTGEASVLGMLWNLDKDTLRCNMNFEILTCETKITKRFILSTVQKVFDANGWLSPATLPPKLLLQETWKLELPWDSELPKNIVNKFMKWANEMYLLKEVTVPRYTAINETSELHIFVDASKSSYGACVFVRTVVENAERVLIRLVQDKMFPNLKSIPIVNVFKDNEGIIRVKTKITERKDDPNFIAPILMPSKCLLTTRLIEYYHLKHCHAGVQILMSILREKFWIMKTRKTAREVVMKCVPCRRYSSNSPMSEPVSLPQDRVKDANAFDITGKAILTNEELLTVLCDCKAVVNSRPLTYVSEDPNDLIPLTPSLFLNGKSSYDTIDLDLSEFSKFQKRIKYRRKLIHDFRSRFRKGYIGQLR